MKQGDRVIHEYLGKGTVIKANSIHLVGMALVKWDNQPPVRYNMGENPTAMFTSDLKPLVEKLE